MPQLTGVTCADSSWIVSRMAANRSMIARFQAQSCFLLSLNRAKSYHVAQVGRAVQLAHHEVVEWVHVAVRPELRGEVSDG